MHESPNLILLRADRSVKNVESVLGRVETGLSPGVDQDDGVGLLDGLCNDTPMIKGDFVVTFLTELRLVVDGKII